MFEKKIVLWVVAGLFLFNGVGFCGEVESDWNDFLHYALIGRFSLANGAAQKIIDGDTDPVELLRLSEENPEGFKNLLKMHSSSEELGEVSGKLLDIIERGRYILRTDPKVITGEIIRLSGTIRARTEAQEHLKNAGEYAIPYMLDALMDNDRKKEFANIASTLPKIGRGAVRPLAAALQMDNVAVKAEIIRALGDIGYPQSLAYLKYAAEKEESAELRELAAMSISKIAPEAMQLPAAELFFQLGESYYMHSESLAAAADYDFANIWFWDKDGQRLVREEVERPYFNELMAMRACEWSLKADEDYGKAIGLWIAAFFKAEAVGIEQPEYFGAGHADAMTYATTAGPEYLHQALERAINEGNAYVSLGVVEALAANAGQKSLLHRIGTQQPLVKALSFDDRAVRYSAAIAIGSAGPNAAFTGSNMIIENLTEALGQAGSEELGSELSQLYSLRAVKVMVELAAAGNMVVELSAALDTLTDTTKGSREQMQILAGEVLARLEDPKAQQAIATMALLEKNAIDVRVAAFKALSVSAKLNANQLGDEQIDMIYSMIGSGQTQSELRIGAASAYGALNLPSKRVKDLILVQSKS